MTKVFLSPSSQTANLVHGGGHEQQYARARCDRAAEVLRAQVADRDAQIAQLLARIAQLTAKEA